MGGIEGRRVGRRRLQGVVLACPHSCARLPSRLLVEPALPTAPQALYIFGCAIGVACWMVALPCAIGSSVVAKRRRVSEGGGSLNDGVPASAGPSRSQHIATPNMPAWHWGIHPHLPPLLLQAMSADAALMQVDALMPKTGAPTAPDQQFYAGV